MVVTSELDASIPNCITKRVTWRHVIDHAKFASINNTNTGDIHYAISQWVKCVRFSILSTRLMVSAIMEFINKNNFA